jgi:hypothetical protein
MDIEKALIELENDLKTKVVRDPKIGQRLAYEVKDSRTDYLNITYDLRECKNVVKAVDELFQKWIPLAPKLEDDIYRYFETYGLWDDNTRAISKKIQTALSRPEIIDDIVNMILSNCDCRKNQPSSASVNQSVNRNERTRSRR